jgi:hypothetical protein
LVIIKGNIFLATLNHSGQKVIGMLENPKAELEKQNSSSACKKAKLQLAFK